MKFFENLPIRCFWFPFPALFRPKGAGREDLRYNHTCRRLSRAVRAQVHKRDISIADATKSKS